MNDQTTVLVTGSDGFIGRHLVPYLAAQGYRVIAASEGRSLSKALTLSPPSFRIYPNRSTGNPYCNNAMPSSISPESLTHLPMTISTTASIIRRPRALAQAAFRRGTHLVFVSSIAAQSGSFSEHELTEDDPPDQTTPMEDQSWPPKRHSHVRCFVYNPAARRDLRRWRKRKFCDHPQDLAPANSIAIRSIDGSTIRAVGPEFLFRRRIGPDQFPRARGNIHRIGSNAAHCFRNHCTLPRNHGETAWLIPIPEKWLELYLKAIGQECNMAKDRLPTRCAAKKTARARLETVLNDRLLRRTNQRVAS